MGLALLGVIVVSPILAIIAYNRSKSFERRLLEIQADLGVLEKRVAVLAKRPRPEAGVAETVPDAPVAPAPAPAAAAAPETVRMVAPAIPVRAATPPPKEPAPAPPPVATPAPMFAPAAAPPPT